jgi:hypothetical protein
VPLARAARAGGRDHLRDELTTGAAAGAGAAMVADLVHGVGPLGDRRSDVSVAGCLTEADDHGSVSAAYKLKVVFKVLAIKQKIIVPSPCGIGFNHSGHLRNGLHGPGRLPATLDVLSINSSG